MAWTVSLALAAPMNAPVQLDGGAAAEDGMPLPEDDGGETPAGVVRGGSRTLGVNGVTDAAAPAAPSPTAPPKVMRINEPSTMGSPADALASKLARLDAFEKEAAADRARRLRAAKHARISAIILTGLGIAAQIGGAIDLAGALGTTHPPAEAFIAIGSHPFIDSIVGCGLSIIGAVMWPVGTAHWVDAQHQINDLSARGNP